MVAAHQDATKTRECSDPILKIRRKIEGMEKTEESSKVIPNTFDIKVFKMRWLVLWLFVLCSASNNMQCFQYTIIANIIRRYYSVSSLAVEWTLMIFMVTYLALVIPASYLMDRAGLRWTVLIGALGTCVGSWIKFFSTSPDRFAVTMTGQFIVAASHVAVITVPGRLSAHWFGPKQLGLATAIACFGGQLGCMICYGATTHVVRNQEKIEDIGKDLSVYFLAQAIFCTVIFLALILLFQDGPPLPPSNTRAFQRANREIDTDAFWPAIKRLLRNKSFLLLCNSFGIFSSILSTVGGSINSLYLAHFKNSENDIGTLGLSTLVTSAMGSMICAYILDKTKRFREITMSVCLLSLLAQIWFAVSMIMGIKWMVFASLMLVGALVVGYTVVGIELCIEITYPESEAISTGILNMSTQIYGALLLLVTGRLLEAYDEKVVHGFLCVNVIIAILFTVINKGELRRQKATQISECDGVPLQVLQPVKT